MKERKHKYRLVYWNSGGTKWEQKVYSKTQLFDFITDMEKLGYTSFEIHKL